MASAWFGWHSPEAVAAGAVVGIGVPDLVFLLQWPWRRYKPLIPLCVNGKCVGGGNYTPVAFNMSEINVMQRPSIKLDGFVVRCKCGAEHFDPGKPLFSKWSWYAVMPGDQLRLLATAMPLRKWRQVDR